MSELPLRVVRRSEVVGFAKTGGLADVAGYLPRPARGHRVAVIMPLYRAVRTGKIPIHLTEIILGVPLGRSTLPCRLWRSAAGERCPRLSRRKLRLLRAGRPGQGTGIYQRPRPTAARPTTPTTVPGSPSSAGPSWRPRARRRSRPTSCTRTTGRPVCPGVPGTYRHRAEYRRMRTLFTIHNIAYQGRSRTTSST